MSRRLWALIVSLVASAPLLAATVTVNDVGDTTGACSTTGTGTCTFRDAIMYANANPGTTIAFDLSGSSVHTLTPSTPYPLISAAVTIDGYSQPGSSANSNGPGLKDNSTHLIEIDCAGPPSGHGITFFPGSAGSVVRGLVINRSVGAAIADFAANDVTIEGCFLGTDPSGSSVPGSESFGVLIDDGATGVLVGGTSPAARNVISGALAAGIGFGNDDGDGGANQVVEGNFIGTDATGTIALGEMQTGVDLAGSATNVRVGGTSDAERNVISGNASGIRLGNGVTASVVEGNDIGTDVTGTLPLGNGTYGIRVEGPGNTIGNASGSGNLIAAAGTNGIEISANGTGVFGNSIGMSSMEQGNLGNAQWGILVNGNNSTIGGLSPGQGNSIENNGTGAFGGIHIESGTGNTISFNNIWLNAGLGIDLGAIGVDANDPFDADSGPNDLQNFPIITSATATPAGTEVQGVLHAAPDTDYRLEFFGNPSCLDRPHDFLQGSYPIGFTTVTTSSGPSGVTTFDVVVPAFGSHVTATATDPNGNTSEFSQRMVFSIAPSSGSPSGGTTIAVQGTDFLAGATVTIGPSAASNVAISSFTQLSAATPNLAPGAVYDVTVHNVDGSAGTLQNGWVADFLDVPSSQQFYTYVTTLVSNGITAGVGGGLYGVNDNTLRQQMAVFILKARNGLCYTPPPCTGTFADVPCSSNFAPWIEAMAAAGITGGCGGDDFCPQNPVRRDQMAVFLLKAEHGSSYVPPMCSGIFPDVPCPSQFANWIEQLFHESITGGCGGGNYCPSDPNTRGQMAVFITKTLGLQ